MHHSSPMELLYCSYLHGAFAYDSFLVCDSSSHYSLVVVVAVAVVAV